MPKLHADGDRRLFTVPASLVGQDLTDALDYISYGGGGGFNVAWAANSNRIIQPVLVK